MGACVVGGVRAPLNFVVESAAHVLLSPDSVLGGWGAWPQRWRRQWQGTVAAAPGIAEKTTARNVIAAGGRASDILEWEEGGSAACSTRF